MVNSQLAWESEKFGYCLSGVWSPCDTKKLEVPALGGILSLPVLQLGKINLPWDYTNDPAGSKTHVDIWIWDALSQTESHHLCQCQETLRAFTIGQALGEIFVFQSWEPRELHEAQLTVKNLYECYHQKTHWTNKTSNNCHKQMLEAKSLKKM